MKLKLLNVTLFTMLNIINIQANVATALPEAGISYSEGEVPSLSSWAIRDKNPYSTTLKPVRFTAPADGFVMVSVTGSGCLYDAGKHIQIWLSDNPDNSVFNYLRPNLFSIANNTENHQPCGVGQEQSFSFQYVQPVKRKITYNFYLKGNKGDSEARGNFQVSPLVVTFYPKRY